MTPTFNVVNGDCLEVMKVMPANSIDSIITDPPYGLEFMGKNWDRGVPGEAYWREALRVAKPGATLLAFGGTRTFHRLIVAIEDAGWIIRDVLSWLYGSGFPKSLDLSKAIDKEAGEERAIVGTKYGLPGYSLADNGRTNKVYGDYHDPAAECSITAPATEAAALWNGWGTGLKPAWEPIIMAMKPLAGTYAANAREWGVAGINIDGCRIAANDGADLARANGGREVLSWGGTYGAGLNGAAVRAAEGLPPLGRWPANLLLDEEAAALLDLQSGELKSGQLNAGHKQGGSAMFHNNNGANRICGDSGGASRFFYVAKASRAERNAGLEGMEEREKKTLNDYTSPSVGRTAPKNGTPQQNFHPTVKPLALMRYLARLTATPTGGVVLDPFFGSGTTGVACILEGRNVIGIDKEAEYCNNIAIPRLQHAVKEWERLQQREAAQPTLEGFAYAD